MAVGNVDANALLLLHSTPSLCIKPSILCVKNLLFSHLRPTCTSACRSFGQLMADISEAAHFKTLPEILLYALERSDYVKHVQVPTHTLTYCAACRDACQTNVLLPCTSGCGLYWAYYIVHCHALQPQRAPGQAPKPSSGAAEGADAAAGGAEEDGSDDLVHCWRASRR